MRVTIQEKLGIKYPIFQAPLAGGIISADFVARVSAFGFLGTIPGGYLSLEQIRAFVQGVKEKTNKPFSLNLFVDYSPYDETLLRKPPEIIEQEKRLSADFSPFFSIVPPPSMDALVSLVIELAVPIVSTTFALLTPGHADKLKSAGVVIMTTVNSVYELNLALNTLSSDIFIYQNSRAGGHKGGFTSLPYSTESEILDSLKNHNEAYCVLAGGIVSKEDVAIALKKGFDAVQIGTAFIATQESRATDDYKMALVQHKKTVCTTSITGKVARGLQNQLAGLEITANLGFPYMHFATTALRSLAKAQGDIDNQSLWCGEGIIKITEILALDELMKSWIG